ncbi:MAG: RNA-binding S4 domain-containing protein [Verrucomicrobiota bacterium]
MEEAQIKVRIDKWLWATRLFKTRTLAGEACKSGHVRIEDGKVKPARIVKVGETIQVQKGVVTRTVKVIGLLEKRVGAKLVEDYLEDHTPEEEWEKARLTFAQAILLRDRGTGRPTKKDRREIEQFFGDL